MVSDKEQIDFLLCCLKNNSAGVKIDFEAVAKELKINSKQAAAKRFERLKKKAQGDLSSSAVSPGSALGSTTGTPGKTGGMAARVYHSPATPTPTRAPRALRTPRSKKAPAPTIEEGYEADGNLTSDGSDKHKPVSADKDDESQLVLNPVRLFASNNRNTAWIAADTSADSISASSITSVEFTPVKVFDQATILPPVPPNSPMGSPKGKRYNDGTLKGKGREMDMGSSKRIKSEKMALDSPPTLADLNFEDVDGKRDSWTAVMQASKRIHSAASGDV